MGGTTQSKLQTIELTLIARHPTAGFKRSPSMKTTAFTNDTYAEFLDRFNTYRGPDTQIGIIYDADNGKQIELTTSIASGAHRIYIN